MTDPVKPRRRYDSRRRREQAAETRAAIVGAAAGLFEESGYPSTTMESVAAAAGVALKTVYLAFANKSGLLRAVWDTRLKGDLADAPVAERSWYREVIEEPDPRRILELNARNSRVVKARIARMLRVIRDAAVVDDDGAVLWSLIQSDFYDNQRAVVEAVRRRRGLRTGLDVERGADILWTLNHPDVWLLLVGDRGWEPARFERWLADASCFHLLKGFR